MSDVRQPFDLRQNEDFIFAKTPWWMSARVLTTSGAGIVLSLAVVAYASLLLGVVRVVQTWVGQ